MKLIKSKIIIWPFTLLLVSILSAAIWWFGPHLSILAPTVNRLGVIMACILLWGISNIVMARRKEDKKGKSTDLKKKHKTEENDEMAEEIVNIFMHAKHFIKKNKKYDVPTYLLIGHAQSGRSAFVHGASIKLFPTYHEIENSAQQSIKFLYGDQAIFIKVDMKVLQAKPIQSIICKELKKYNNKYTLDGIVLCHTAQEIQHHIKNLEEKPFLFFNALEKYLERRLPIYFLITKSDTIFGFDVFFDSYNTEQRKQILGVTFERSPNSLIQQFQEKSLQLVKYLNSQVLEYVQTSTDVEANKRMLHLPYALAQLNQSIAQYIKLLFEETPYQEKQILRGIYFTSTHRKTRNYFVHQLCHELILKEHRFKALSKKCCRKMKIIHGLIYLSVACFIVGGSILWFKSYSLNHQLLFSLNNHLKRYQSSTASAAPDLLTLQSLSDVDALLDVQSKSEAMGYGLYVGDRLRPSVDAIFTYDASQLINPILQKTFKARLMTEKGMSLYRSVMVYLMLNDPAKKNMTIIKSWLSENPIIQYKNNHNQQIIWNNILLRYLAKQKQPLVHDAFLVAHARNKLKSLTTTQRAYFALQQQASGQPDLTLLNNFSSSVAVFREPIRNIPYLYTNTGMEQLYNQWDIRAVKQAIQNDWVLARPNINNFTQVKSSLDVMYVNRYINTWNTVLFHLRIVPFKNLESAARILQALSNENSPIKQVLQTLSDNTDFSKQNRIEVAIAHSFLPLNKLLNPSDKKQAVLYQNIQNELAAVSNYLNILNSAENPNAAAYQAAKNGFSGKGACIDQLAQISINVPEPVKSWLNTIVKQTRQVILKTAQRYEIDIWQG